jgi:hypothetical protein
MRDRLFQLVYLTTIAVATFGWIWLFGQRRHVAFCDLKGPPPSPKGDAAEEIDC